MPDAETVWSLYVQAVETSDTALMPVRRTLSGAARLLFPRRFHRLKNRLYYRNHPDKRREALRRQWVRRAAQQREYKASRRAILLEQDRAYRLANREKSIERKRRYRELHREEDRARSRAWREAQGVAPRFFHPDEESRRAAHCEANRKWRQRLRAAA